MGSSSIAHTFFQDAIVIEIVLLALGIGGALAASIVVARQYGDFAANENEKSPLSEFTNGIRRSKESDTHNADIFMKASGMG